jgi:hypothetical protein
MSEQRQIKLGRKTFTVLFPDLLRPLTPDERAGLEAGIRDLGFCDPVTVDEDDGVIDGANRLEIAAKLGLTAVPTEVHRGLTAQKKRALAESLNVNRRQLSPEDRERMRAERIEQVAEDKRQGKSTRQIAEDRGISQTQVRLDLKEAGEQSCSPDSKVTGRDGKTYPATRPAPREPEQPRLTASPVAGRLVPADPPHTGGLVVNRTDGGGGLQPRAAGTRPAHRQEDDGPPGADLAEALKWARDRKRVSVEEVAAKCGLPEGRVALALGVLARHGGYAVEHVYDGDFKVSRAVHFAYRDEDTPPDLYGLLKELYDEAREALEQDGGAGSNHWGRNERAQYLTKVTNRLGALLEGFGRKRAAKPPPKG